MTSNLTYFMMNSSVLHKLLHLADAYCTRHFFKMLFQTCKLFPLISNTKVTEVEQRQHEFFF